MRRYFTFIVLALFAVTVLSTDALAQRDAGKNMTKPSVVYGEIVSIDMKNKNAPQVTVKDTRSGKNVTVALDPQTRLLKTVYLDAKDLKKGEPARIIYKDENGAKVARMVFVREEPKGAPKKR